MISASTDAMTRKMGMSCEVTSTQCNRPRSATSIAHRRLVYRVGPTPAASRNLSTSFPQIAMPSSQHAKPPCPS